MNWRKEWVIPSGVGILSFTLGAVIGYAYSQRKGTREVITVVNNLKADVKDRDSEQRKVLDEVKSIVHLKHELDTLVEVPVELTRDELEEAEARERTAIELGLIREAQARGNDQFNVFDGPDDAWDYDVEVPLRTPDAPYIIHRDEFFADEENNSQSTLTYYAGDDVLCDEHDSPVYDYKRVVGVLEFGKGSQDISIVYVRNEKLQAEWEIIIDHGYFQTEVLGEEIEHSYERRDLKHSLHKFREDE